FARLLRMVEHHGESRVLARKRGDAARLVATDDGRGEQDGPDTRGRERLGLADLGAADPDRPRLELSSRDRGALVALRMWTQRQPGRAGPGCHASDVGLESVELGEEHRGGKPSA